MSNNSTRVAMATVAVMVVLAMALKAASADDKPWFSGKTTPYKDTFNGFIINIPEELVLKDKGPSTYWGTQEADGSAVEIHVTTTAMPGVPSIAMFEPLLKAKKQDPNYKDVVALPNVKLGNKTVYAFRCSEADHKAGMADAKESNDIHRWHVYVFGNDRQYLLQFNAPYSAFQSKKVQDAFNAAIKSFVVVAAK